MDSTKSVTIAIAEDDPDDRMMIEDALRDCHILNPVDFLEDGEALMRYLRREAEYAGLAGSDLPGLILLDLNMPRKDGREALAEIKSDPDLRHVPVIVMTTSRSPDDVAATYDIGANSYVAKPILYEELLEVLQTLGKYWLEVVDLPGGEARSSPQFGPGA